MHPFLIQRKDAGPRRLVPGKVLLKRNHRSAYGVHLLWLPFLAARFFSQEHAVADVLLPLNLTDPENCSEYPRKVDRFASQVGKLDNACLAIDLVREYA